jgi:hypothetical protein
LGQKYVEKEFLDKKKLPRFSSHHSGQNLDKSQVMSSNFFSKNIKANDIPS